MAEKLVLLVADHVLGQPPVTAGTYKSLDGLAKRGQSGYLSSFADCTDTISQLIGSCYHSAEDLAKELGPMKLAVLKSKSTYAGFGDHTSITGLSLDDVYNKIQEKLGEFNVVVVEAASLGDVDSLVGLLLAKMDETNVAVCVVCGFVEGAKLPEFRQPPPVVDPSWKVIGPNVVDRLTLDKPYMYVSASQKLTRIDRVQAFDEADIAAHCGMGIEPICQLFREYSYYTGSSWKYGA